jgi:putative hemolysin
MLKGFRRKVAIALAVFTAAALANCARDGTPALGTTKASLANPASEHCVKSGGRLEIRKDKAGNEYGVCLMPDGRVCEEWALFRDNKCVTPAKPD